MVASADVKETLVGYLKELHLPAFRSGYEELARQAQQEGLSYERYLLGLAERECQERRANRIERLLRESRLPLEKSWPALDLKRFPSKVLQQARLLLEGSFVDRRENVLTFGAPGSGKTHLLAAIAQELVRAGYPSSEVRLASPGKLSWQRRKQPWHDPSTDTKNNSGARCLPGGRRAA